MKSLIAQAIILSTIFNCAASVAEQGAPEPIHYKFEDGRSLRVDTVGKKLHFHLCYGQTDSISDCERLGRETGYSIQQLRNAQWARNLRRWLTIR